MTLRTAFSVALQVVAGFLFYTVSLLAFVSEPPATMKFGLMLVFFVPAVLALTGGLALARFRNWQFNAGVVLLCASGFAAFVVLTIACLLITDEFRLLIRHESLAYFGDYLAGSGVVVGLAGVGWTLARPKASGA